MLCHCLFVPLNRFGDFYKIIQKRNTQQQNHQDQQGISLGFTQL